MSDCRICCRREGGSQGREDGRREPSPRVLLPALPGSRLGPRCILGGGVGGCVCVFSRKSFLGAFQSLFFPTQPSNLLLKKKKKNQIAVIHTGFYFLPVQFLSSPPLCPDCRAGGRKPTQPQGSIVLLQKTKKSPRKPEASQSPSALPQHEFNPQLQLLWRSSAGAPAVLGWVFSPPSPRSVLKRGRGGGESFLLQSPSRFASLPFPSPSPPPPSLFVPAAAGLAGGGKRWEGEVAPSSPSVCVFFCRCVNFNSAQ